METLPLSERFRGQDSGPPPSPLPDGSLAAAAEDAPLTGFGDPPGSGAPVWVATVERVRDVEAAVRSRMARPAPP